MTEQQPERWYRITHRTIYTYSDTVSESYGRGHLRPRDLTTQRSQDFSLTIEPAPGDVAESTDVYGNRLSYFHVVTNHRELQVLASSTVGVGVDPGEPSDGEPWESARPTARTDPMALDFVGVSPMLDIGDAVRQYAAVSLAPGRPLAEAIRDLMSRIHGEFEYRSGSTAIGTPTADLLVRRSGVCQDFAHLAVACLRSRGLAARYVSGYLATDPPPGKERMTGVDATHAWAAVRTTTGRWLAFDPTNDQFVDARYTTVAWGRDYSDVPPLRGVIFTDATTSTMSVLVDVAPLPAPPNGRIM